MKTFVTLSLICCSCLAFGQQSAVKDTIFAIDTAAWNQYGARMYDARLGRYYNPTLFVSDSMAKVYGFTRPELPVQEEKKKIAVKAK